MNNDYKKGFLEAIDGVLDILNETNVDLDKEKLVLKMMLKNIENSVLGLKVAFFESYYENCDEVIITDDDFKRQSEIDCKKSEKKTAHEIGHEMVENYRKKLEENK